MSRITLVLVAALCVSHAFAAIAVKSTGQCGSACPFGNNNCTTPSCSRCDGPHGFGGICVRGFACASKCAEDGDCDQTTDCRFCMNGKCTASCGMPCTASTQCAASPCSSCIQSTCQKWTCGNTCSKSSDCAGACGTCTNGKCISECGNVCIADSDCPFGCGSCVDGTCQAGMKCKSACTTNLECSASTGCGQCISGVCAAGCGMNCTASSQCTSECGKCVEGQCMPWLCGTACTNSSHCAGTCAMCANSTCHSTCGGFCSSSKDCPYMCSKCSSGSCVAP